MQKAHMSNDILAFVVVDNWAYVRLRNSTQSRRIKQMAAFDIYRANNLTAAKSGLNLTWISSTIASIIVWNDQRVTRNALTSLSIRQLDDIGLTPGDIDDMAYSASR